MSGPYRLFEILFSARALLACFARMIVGGWGLTLIIRPISVLNWTGTELANWN